MSKITFRADDDLVERLEALDASKSEAMRDALRTYLDGAARGDTEPTDDGDGTSRSSHSPAGGDAVGGPVDDVIRERVDELVADRLDELVADRVAPAGGARDLNVNVSVDGVKAVEEPETRGSEAEQAEGAKRKTRGSADGPDGGVEADSKPCEKCGETVGADHVYCPNCGEKASHRVFCECGDELRSDWAFCPSCGRRTSAADVLERT